MLSAKTVCIYSGSDKYKTVYRRYYEHVLNGYQHDFYPYRRPNELITLIEQQSAQFASGPAAIKFLKAFHALFDFCCDETIR